MITETPEKLARPLIYVIAGEVSGDIIGARLIREIKCLRKHKFSFAGVGGEQMTIITKYFKPSFCQHFESSCVKGQ